MEVLRQILWRGVVRPQRQHHIERRLASALQLFFDTPLARHLRRAAPDLFDEYLISVFEFDWMTVEEVLEVSGANRGRPERGVGRVGRSECKRFVWRAGAALVT